MTVETLKAQWDYNKRLNQVLRESYKNEQDPEVRAKLLKCADESDALDDQYWQAMIDHHIAIDTTTNSDMCELEKYEKTTKLLKDFKLVVEQYRLKSTQLHEELIRIQQSK